MMAKQFDQLDLQILSLLAEVSPLSNVEIAARLGASEATIRRRIKTLNEDGTLEFIVLLNPEKIGLHTQAIIGIDVDMNKAPGVAKTLASLAQVKYLAYVTGRYDLIMTAYFHSEDELFEFLTNVLPNIPGVLNSETMRILKTSKRSWRFTPDGPKVEIPEFMQKELSNDGKTSTS